MDGSSDCFCFVSEMNSMLKAGNGKVAEVLEVLGEKL